jgi:uncharacterized repeat protein (TIGR03803 family)
MWIANRLAIATFLTAVVPLAAQARSVTTIYSFTGGADGSGPVSGVIDVNGMLFGTTENGGVARLGVVFALDPATGAETVLHSFSGSPDGAYPAGRLIERDGTLFGTTQQGGETNYPRRGDRGVVFNVNIETGAEQALSFHGPQKPREPLDGVVYLAGKLYGISQEGGVFGDGTLFSLRVHSDRYVHSIYSLNAATDSAKPIGDLVAHGGLLYGTDPTGGTYNQGSVFSFDPATTTETLLYNFGAQTGDGNTPASALIYHDGILYGVTSRGGALDNGTVFSFDLASGTETVLYTFAGGNDGSTPSDSLLYRNGNLYGTTGVGGGRANGGTVYKVDAVTGAEKVLVRFGVNGNGANPDGPVIFLNGSFYGTTFRGGASGAGTVFRLQE